MVDMVELKRMLIDFAHSVGIDKIGFASADPFLELKDRLYKHRELGYESGFEESDIEKRAHPELTIQEAKSIIAIAIAYPARMEDSPKSKPGEYRGMVSRAAWGKDYHHVLREKLRLLEAFIEEKLPGARCESMVDTGVLSDRAVAERAGLGWIGKNTNLITPEFGSWVYLGELITDIPFPPDQPIEESCGDCTLCLDHCPTGAFEQPFQLNAQKCVAFLTQVKDYIPEEYRERVGNRLYGCDTCQQVCPKNRKVNFTHQEDCLPDPELAKPLLKPLLTIGKKEFQTKFGPTSAAWRGKKPIQRNAILALAHFKDRTAVPDLISLMKKDERPVIRGTAAWALGKIGGEEAMQALEEARSSEKDQKVQAEIDQAWSKLRSIL
ncbi:tRNA epoxyqueuosine(34) reductase QueG [Ammoniphilus sp. CFH 90114]|uniref:tRNA epoxyqueuosine(34) reductase QueG n=1 Tax=Ammoniphilus sp. CFH 90114 TaxID=2493665 RepID=UPI00100FC547|nr:tRNA epoxyqueuosine(34) reductase QueG [Ammoniphilus sp. CFH 90114]RXT04819.1 tRNA epoxyqueuosine(34) reductase QueG [Ammoniphilus sp. CFH 90114]